MIETATFWKDGPEIETGELRTEDIGTEVFFLPAAAHTEKDGSFTNTQRLLQWHHKAVEPPGDAAQRAVVLLPPRPDHPGEAGASSTDPRDRPLLDLTWDYPTEGPLAEPSAEAVLRGDQRVRRRTARRCRRTPSSRTTARRRAAAGSTAACYADGSTRPPGASPAASRAGWRRSGDGRGRPTGASSTTARRPTRDGRPWSERKALRLVGRGRRASGPATTSPTSRGQARRDYGRRTTRTAEDALRGDDPFIMQADGKGWLFAPAGLVGRPAADALRAARVAGAQPAVRPAGATRRARSSARPDNRYAPRRRRAGSDVYPYVVHDLPADRAPHRRRDEPVLPYLAELQPELFCEVSPGAGAPSAGSSTAAGRRSSTARTAIEARVLVTERIAPLRVGGRVVHQVGLPYHWGPRARHAATRPTTCSPSRSTRTCTSRRSRRRRCDIRPGRRPRGPGLPRCVAEYRRRAGITERTGDGHDA